QALGPVGRRVPQAEVDVVHLHLPPAGEHQGVRRPFGAADVPGGAVPGLLGQGGAPVLQAGGGAPDVGRQLGRRPAGAGGDVGGPPGVTPRVLVDHFVPGGPFEPPDDAVGVAGDVGQHVAHRPVREVAGRPALLVGETGEVVQQGPVGAAAAVDVHRRDPSHPDYLAPPAASETA